jgi:hypothetical protein
VFRATTSVTVRVVAVAILVGHGAIEPVDDAAAAVAFRHADLAHHEPPRPVAQRHAVPGERVEHLEQRRQDRDVRGELPRHPVAGVRKEVAGDPF